PSSEAAEVDRRPPVHRRSTLEIVSGRAFAPGRAGTSPARADGMTPRTTTIALLFSLVAPARADLKDGAVHRATVDLNAYAWALGVLRQGKWDPGRPLPDPAQCTAAIERARANGLVDDDVLRDPSFEHAPGGRPSGGYHHEIRLGQAPELCS